MRWHRQTITSGGVRLAVRDSGGHASTAVLLHGLGAPQRSWDRVADRPVSRVLSRVATAAGMGARLSLAELRRVAEEAARREEHLEEVYARLPCSMLVVLAGKADPVPHGEAMLAAVDAAATRLQQLHPQVKLARLPCGHAIPLKRPRELADLIVCFAESSPARS
jgi:hypothetical protein